MIKCIMPAEWEAQKAVWFAWPYSKVLWSDCRGALLNDFSRMLAVVSKTTKIKLICCKSFQAQAKPYLEKCKCTNYDFIDFETDDVWCRDFGPIFANRGSERVLVNWGFNAWGKKFPDYKRDNAIPEKLAGFLGLEVLDPGVILEGGAVEVNGADLALSTESVLLNTNRNQNMSKKKLEGLLADFFGPNEILWLSDGLVNDDTDGHIDNISRFVAERVVVTCICDESNPNYKILNENKARLEQYRFADGGRLEVIDLPLPDAMYLNGELLPASYANFLISNQVVFIPSFNQTQKDKQAQDILQKCFPTYRVEAIDCRLFLREGGAIHCLTQQEPI